VKLVCCAVEVARPALEEWSPRRRACCRLLLLRKQWLNMLFCSRSVRLLRRSYIRLVWLIRLSPESLALLLLLLLFRSAFNRWIAALVRWLLLALVVGSWMISELPLLLVEIGGFGRFSVAILPLCFYLANLSKAAPVRCFAGSLISLFSILFYHYR